MRAVIVANLRRGASTRLRIGQVYRALSGSAAPDWQAEILKTHGLEVRRVEGRGRGLYVPSQSPGFKAGDVVLTEAPLVAVASPAAAAAREHADCCMHCFRRIGTAAASPARVVCGCGYSYCSEACRAGHAAEGHEALCGLTTSNSNNGNSISNNKNSISNSSSSSSPTVAAATSRSGMLDAFCMEHGVNFPRVAAAVLARSLAPAEDFAGYWARLTRLATVTLPPGAAAGDADALPALWRTGYALVKDTIRPAMGGQVEPFFEHVFTLRLYAVLMGSLRLNSFSLACPLDRATAAAANASASGTAGAGASGVAVQPMRVEPPADASLAAAAAAAAAATAVEGSTAGGCCSTDSSSTSSGSDSSCGSDAESCGSGGGGGAASLVAGDVGVQAGSALYSVASLVNHSCDPVLSVTISPHAILALTARRDLPPGAELTIAYLDCSAPLAERRRKLLSGYGFTCKCELCESQAAAAIAAEAAAKRAARAAAAAAAHAAALA